MTWCISHTCIACSFLTGTTMCPVPMRRSGRRGPRSSVGFHRRGYHQQSGLNCTGLRTIMCKAGLPWDVRRDNESVAEASVLTKYLPLQRDGAGGQRGAIRVGCSIPPGRYE